MTRLVEVSPGKPTPCKDSKSAPGRSMFITERMIDAHGPTDECPKRSTGRGARSAACRQKFERIPYDLLQEKLKGTQVATESNADATIVSKATGAVGPAPSAPDAGEASGIHAGEDSNMGISQDAVGPAPGSIPGSASSTTPDANMKAVRDGETPGVAGVKKTRVASIGLMRVCELAICEGGFDEAYDPAWDPIPCRSERCFGRCHGHGRWCQLRATHRTEVCCRRCLMVNSPNIYSVTLEDVEDIVEGDADMEEHQQWQIPAIHSDYFTGEPLDEQKYQVGKEYELVAIFEYGVYFEFLNVEVTGGKHIRGFPLYHMKDGGVRWRFVVCELNDELSEDNHRYRWSTPEVARYMGDVRKAFFNASLDELIYVHPGKELCRPVYSWCLKNALYGTRKASQLRGQTVRIVMDNGGWITLVGGPSTWYWPSAGGQRPEEEQCANLGRDATASCHGGDYLVEGYEDQLMTLNCLLESQSEVTRGAHIGPGMPGQAKDFKRIVGYTDTLPDDGDGGSGETGFFWAADCKHVDLLVKWSKKRCSKPAPTPAAKATGVGAARFA